MGHSPFAETQRPPPELIPVVADHALLRRIGGGAYGDVWLARSVTGTYRAVKVVWRARFEHERTYEREFSGLKRFEPVSRLHPALIDVLQIGRDDRAQYFYYVLELADPAELPVGEFADTYVPLTLDEVLRRRGRLPIRECARLGSSIAEALQFLHQQGLVHRDIKPSNIIFVGGQPKLADIGLVTGLDDARSFVGTEGYIPPEGPGAPAADLFSLGKVLYELATGKNRLDFPDLPGDLPNLLTDAGEITAFAELNEIILRACAPVASQRHRSAEEFRGELLLVDAGRSVRRLRRNERLVTRWRRLGVVAAVLGLLGVAGVKLERDRTAEANRRATAEAEQRRVSEGKELAARLNVYAADMNLAQQACEAGNYGRAEELLAGHIPQPGVADLRGFEWYHYWQRVRGDSVAILRGHEQVVSSLVLSRDGQSVFSASFDGSVREWSLADLKERRRWTLPDCFIMSLAQDATGTRLAIEGGNRSISGLLDLATGQWVTHASSASPSICFTPEGDRLLRGARMLLFETNGVVEITDLALRGIRVLEESGGRAWFSPDGRLLVTGPWGEDLKLWSWPSLEPRGELPGAGVVLGLAFSPDSRRLVTGSREGQLNLWDLTTRTRLQERSTHDNSLIWSLAFSPDGTRLASAGNDQTVRAWDAATLTEQHVFRGHGSEVWAVVWTQDGRQLISAGKDTTLRIWNAVPSTRPLELTQVVHAAIFSPDERFLAVHHRTEGLTLWQLDPPRRTLSFGSVSEVGGFAPDGDSITILRPDGTFERLSTRDGHLLETRSLEAAHSAFTRRRISPNGRWLVTGQAEGGLWVYDVANGGPPKQLRGHDQQIISLEISPDGQHLLSGSLDRTARLWDLATGKQLGVLSGHRMGVGSMAFSPDGTQLATGSWDDTVHLWDARSQVELAVFGGHANSVHDVAFTPDRRSLMVLSGAATLKYWSLGARREAGITQLERGTGQGWLTVSPGGHWLAAVSPSGRLTLVAAPVPPPEKVR